MEWIRIAAQIIIPLGILNVWFLRAGRPTPFRGRDASSLKEEFHGYGLTTEMFYIVGSLKISAALMILAAFLIPALRFPGALLMTVLMVGALVMHIRVKDPVSKSIPAGIMLALSLVLLV